MADETRKDELTDQELEQSVGGRRTARGEKVEEAQVKPAGPKKLGGPVMTTLALGEEGQEGGGILR